MRVLFFSLAVVVADQISKFLVKGLSIPALGLHIQGMMLGESRPVIGDVFHITYIENPNMAFGIEFGGKVFLSVFALIASIALVAYLYRMRQERFGYRFALAMIFAGAVGNLIDRIFHGLIYGTAPIFQGNVVDFFDFNLFTINWGSFHFKFWPIFNIADMAVSFGVVSLLLFYRPTHRTEPAPGAQPNQTETAPDPSLAADTPAPQHTE